MQNRKAKNAEIFLGETGDLVADQTARLKEIFPESVADGKIDFEKLRATLGDELESRPERFAFTWAGKREAIRLLQTPTHSTLIPSPATSINFSETENIFIEGDNLEVLKLLYKPYFSRVKLIYIDPPYNTGNDFIYPDNFADPLDTYLKLTGQKAENGDFLTSNPETGGRYHSAWLSMMYPRLFLGRQLLRDDGVIFVSIDNNELANLRLLMNEIFGEENFVGIIVVQSNPRGRHLEEFVATSHEYLLVYARSISDAVLYGSELTDKQVAEYREVDDKGQKYRLLGLRKRGAYSRREDRPNLHYPIFVHPDTFEISTERKTKKDVAVLPKLSDGKDGVWRWSKKKVDREKSALEARVVSGRNEIDIFQRDYLRENGVDKTTMFKSLWLDKSMNYELGKERIKELFGEAVFDAPKPVGLLTHVVQMGSENDDIVLDFFGGACTTADALLELNRKDDGARRFIIVQLPEPTPKDSPARKAGFKDIAELGEERIRKVIGLLKKGKRERLDLNDRDGPEDLGFKVFKLSQSNFKPWTVVEGSDADAYAKQMALFVDPLLSGAKPENVITEVAIKEGLSLNGKTELVGVVSGQTVYRVSDPEKQQSFYICLDSKLDGNKLKALNLKKDDLFVCRDAALTDGLAANLALQCRLKTI